MSPTIRIYIKAAGNLYTAQSIPNPFLDVELEENDPDIISNAVKAHEGEYQRVKK